MQDSPLKKGPRSWCGFVVMTGSRDSGTISEGGNLRDLVTANSNGNALQVFLGNGDGSFHHFGSFAAADHPIALAVGDLNGDGFPDLAAVSAGSNDLSVLLNAAEGPIPASHNHPQDWQTFARSAFSMAPGAWMPARQRDLAAPLEVGLPREYRSARIPVETCASTQDRLITWAAITDDVLVPSEKRCSASLDPFAITGLVRQEDPLRPD